MLQTSDIRYFINEEKRTVTAIHDFGIRGDAFENILKADSATPIDIDWDYSGLRIDDKVVAVAKCHPEDEFDVEKGIEVARKKLLQKYNRMKFKAIERYIKTLDRHKAVCESVMKSIEKRCNYNVGK